MADTILIIGWFVKRLHWVHSTHSTTLRASFAQDKLDWVCFGFVFVAWQSRIIVIIPCKTDGCVHFRHLGNWVHSTRSTALRASCAKDSLIGFVWVRLGSFYPSPPSVVFFIIDC